MSELSALVSKVNKSLRRDALITGAELKSRVFPRATSGSLTLDVILGGGWPMNVWCELVGQPSAGKSLIAMKTVAALQRENPDHETLWVAAEEFVPEWAQTCGVDLDRMVVADMNEAEAAMQLVVDALKSRAADAIIIDSLPALIPSKESEEDTGAWHPGLQARLMNQFMRKSGTDQRRSLTEDDRNCLCLAINQWRYKIGVMHGDPRTTPGGAGKDFSYFVRAEVSRTDWITGKANRRIGQTIKVRTLKNKTAPPQQVCVLDFYFDQGGPVDPGQYDSLNEILNVALVFDVVEQGGGYYSFNGERIADRGRESVLEQLRYDLTLQENIRAEVMRLALHR